MLSYMMLRKPLGYRHYVLFSKEMYPQINNIHLESPNIHVVVMSDSLANYQITEQNDSSASSLYHLNAIKKYNITNANVKYDDYVIVKSLFKLKI